ncbi:MAG: GGDEF domain-containing protein [Chromatiales bacterium]|nr:MAG: GGDEF domain-containing protein [Chromatiales bacterium]
MSYQFFYIIFSLMVISAVLSLTFFMAWKNFGHEKHALTWAAAFLAGMLQWGCTVNVDLFPSLESYLLTETALSIAMITLGLRGHCQRTRCRHLPRNLWPCSVAVYSIIVWHILVSPHTGIRMSVVPFFAAITLGMSSYLIISFRQQTRPAEWAAAIAIAIFGVSQFGTGILAFMQGAVANESVRAVYLHFNFLTLPAGYIATSMLIILMMASDIAAQMREMAIKDQLTGLLNRRGFSENGERAFSAARRSDQPLSVIMTDIDRFKFINDKYGHAAGDTALAHFANLVSEDRRQEDIVARVGGEEFALLLPGTELRDAMAIADQLCKKIGATPLKTTVVGLPMTSSFGVAAISDNDATLDDMVLRADRALYRSKRAGRNQVDLESSQMLLAEDGSLQPLS